MSFTDREKQILLASCWGVLDALVTDRHLGDAARKRKLESRTLKGDAYETAFEWARQEKQFYRQFEDRAGDDA